MRNIVALLIVVGLLASLSCSFFNKEVKNAESIADCTVKGMDAKVALYSPIFAATLLGDAIDWQGTLENFLKALGSNVFTCTLQDATKQITAGLATSAASGPPAPTSAGAVAKQRAARFMADHHLRVR